MSDLISRKAAIDALKKYEEFESNYFTATSPISMMTVATIANCIEEIVNLPSAEPERKKGEWIKDGRERGFSECSKCGYIAVSVLSERLYNFCPNCGAEMVTGTKVTGQRGQSPVTPSASRGTVPVVPVPIVPGKKGE